MPNSLLGQISLRNVLVYTYQSKFRNRFKFASRDVLKAISIEEVKEFSGIDRNFPPQVKYRITAFSDSFPNYKPYNSHVKEGSKQRKYRHQYINVIELNKLSLDSPFKWRVGADRKWIDNPPKALLKVVGHEERKTIRASVDRTYKNKDANFRNEEYKKRIALRKKSAKYLDVGDFNSREKGLNGDFYFRLSNILKKMNCLYGKVYCPEKPDDVIFPFLDKHTTQVITTLLQKGIISY